MGDFPASHVGWKDLEWSNHKRYRPHRGQATNTMSIKKVKNADRMKIPPGIMDMTWGLFRQDFFDIVFCCLCKSASQGMQFLKDIVKWIAARFLCVLRWVSQQCASPQWMLQLFQAVTLVTKQHFSPITSPFSRHFFDCWMLLLISLRSVASKQLRHVVSVCVDILHVSKMRQLKIDCSLKLWVCYATGQHTWTLWAFSISKYLKPIVIYTSIKTTSAKRWVFFLFGSHIFQQVVFLDDAIKSRATGPIHVVQVWIVVGEFRRVWD